MQTAMYELQRHCERLAFTTTIGPLAAIQYWQHCAGGIAFAAAVGPQPVATMPYW